VSFRPPKHRLHKGSGQALVQLNGERTCLGEYGSEESKDAYRRLVAESLASGRPPRTNRSDTPARLPRIPINDLILTYRRYSLPFCSAAIGGLLKEMHGTSQRSAGRGKRIDSKTRYEQGSRERPTGIAGFRIQGGPNQLLPSYGPFASSGRRDSAAARDLGRVSRAASPLYIIYYPRNCASRSGQTGPRAYDACAK
jgi:hypothetical protein